MSRECPSDAPSRRLFSVSAARPRLRRSTFRRQSVALFTVAIDTLDGCTVVLTQAAALALAGATVSAVVAASSPRPIPRIDWKGRDRGAWRSLVSAPALGV